MRLCYYLVVTIVLLLWCSCRTDFEYGPSAGNLEFSKDTVYLDTIFGTIASSTYTLKVFNPTRDDVVIPAIGLAQGQNSSYRLNVDGAAGKEFKDILLYAQDSLFIFIETVLDIPAGEGTSFLNTDAIQFDSGNHLQEVHLVTLVKDAQFLFPGTSENGIKETVPIRLDTDTDEIQIEGFLLEDHELHFTDQRPYVIYGYAVVPEGKELVVDPGSRIHFHKASGILVQKEASIQVNGSLSMDEVLQENAVVFEGDRLEPQFSEVPGQWGGIWIVSGSNGNNLSYATVKNATVGVYVEGDGLLESNTLTLKNSSIFNSANINLWAKKAVIHGENNVLGSAGSISLYCNLGGSYSFLHSTIANYWANGFRNGSALEIDNYNATTTAKGDLLKASFVNCIIDGAKNIELSLRSNQENEFSFSFTNCLLKFVDNVSRFDQEPRYDFANGPEYTNIFLNENLQFTDPFRNDYKIEEGSAANGKGDLETAHLVPLDILGRDRTQSPEIGAFEIVENK